MREAVVWWRWFAVLGPLSLIITAALLAMPGIDLAVSGMAGDPVAGFALADSVPLAVVRGLILVATAGLVLAMIAAVLLGAVRSGWRPVPLREGLFALSCMALGPGLLVNGILKHVSGRVRPLQTVAFGGTLPFQPAFDFSGPCGVGCSFVSAETAGVATAMMCLVLLLRPRLGPRAGKLLIWAASLSVAAIAAIRIALGAHFPSDVVYSILVTAALVLALHIAFGLGRLSPRASPVRDAFSSVGHTAVSPGLGTPPLTGG